MQSKLTASGNIIPVFFSYAVLVLVLVLVSSTKNVDFKL